jgi:hypothetical protein
VENATEKESSARYRRTIPEYILECELYAFRDLVVEGQADGFFYLEVLRRYGLLDVGVLSADFFNIPATAVKAAGFNVGAKGGLLTLACALSDRSAEVSLAARVVVVVDRDYDEELPEKLAGFVVVTDGYSIENYALSSEALQRFAQSILGRGELPDGDRPRKGSCTEVGLYDRVVPACVEVAAARRALRRVSKRVGLFKKWADYVRVSDTGVATANGEKLLKNIFERISVKKASSIAEILSEERLVVSSDPFRYVRGHDFILVLHRVLKSSWGRKFSKKLNCATIPEETLQRILLLCVESSELDQMELFKELRLRFAA